MQTALEVSITDSVTCQSLCFFVANVAGESAKKQNKDRFIARMDAWRKKKTLNSLKHHEGLRGMDGKVHQMLIWPQDVESQNLILCICIIIYLYYMLH